MIVMAKKNAKKPAGQNQNNPQANNEQNPSYQGNADHRQKQDKRQPESF